MFPSASRSSAGSATSIGCSTHSPRPRLLEQPRLESPPEHVGARPASGRLTDRDMATDLRLPTDRIVRPDKDRFLNEENPFEAMMSRFDRAAELLDLEPGLYKVLRKPEKQLIVSCPVMMDNGEIEVYTGIR